MLFHRLCAHSSSSAPVPSGPPRLTGSPGFVGGTSCPSFRVALSMRMCSCQRGEAFKSEDLIFTRTEKTVPPTSFLRF